MNFQLSIRLPDEWRERVEKIIDRAEAIEGFRKTAADVFRQALAMGLRDLEYAIDKAEGRAKKG